MKGKLINTAAKLVIEKKRATGISISRCDKRNNILKLSQQIQ